MVVKTNCVYLQLLEIMETSWQCNEKCHVVNFPALWCSPETAHSAQSAMQHIEVAMLFAEQCSVHFKFSAGLQFELSDKKVL